MASNPPLQVEDQTDEDFFDKLVEEEDDFKVNPNTTPVVDAGDDSDLDVKAFTNLSIADSAVETKVAGIHENVHTGSSKLEEKEKVDSMPVVADNSFGVDNSFESNDEDIGSDGGANFPTNSGSSALGVKEVQWSSFYADSTENGAQGFRSYSDFFSDLGEVSEDQSRMDVKSNVQSNGIQGTEEFATSASESSYNYWQYQEGQGYGATTEQVIKGQDQSSSQYWENMYPGWNYDANTGQWYQVEGYDATANAQEGVETNLSTGTNVSDEWAGTDGKSQFNYLQQTAHSMAGTVTETSTSETVSNWSQHQQGNNEYPAHMVFDPQYPGWYYDSIAQEWHSLESYTQSIQSTVQATEQQPSENGPASIGAFSNGGSHSYFGEYGHANNLGLENHSNQGQNQNWDGSFSNYCQQGMEMWQTHAAVKSESHSNFDPSQHFYAPKDFVNHANQQEPAKPVSTIPAFETVSQSHDNANGFVGFQGFVPSGNFKQQNNKPKVEQNEQMHFPDDYYGSQKPVNFSQQPLQNGHQFNYAANRSSAARPPHALVTFGFGGKLVVMKDISSLTSSTYGSQDQPVGGAISVLNLVEVVPEKTDVSSRGLGSCDYIRALCHQCFPGPLVGGNVGNKELNKWIDERIAKCESPDMDYRKGEVLRLLLSLLKIACQHYGKLRSPFSSDSALKENDSPEAAVAKLFASVKRHGAQYGALTHCLQQLPSEGQIRATAAEVQSLLVSGKKREALQCAQEGQLWGPALILAAQLGDQFYVDTVKQMALHQLVAGSPLRTLCLLIAGQPADVFAANSIVGGGISSANTSQFPAQFEANGMLDDWEENLAVITANRTKDDELVLIHLGDCLWKERSMIIAAHICYLVAERNFESYSDSARMCLAGADHWKCPRTYASPEAIQVLGNSQYILLPFQPYKLVYAHMLAEVGKVSDSLKYCQSILKSLKTGRGPEVELWKQLVTSLEERIRTHQQGGYTTNLAPAKLVGKLLNFFDSTAHRVVGGLPPPVPSSQNGNEHHQQVGPRVSTSQSKMAMSSLMPSASMEPISEWTTENNKLTVQNRSVSEPDFGRSPRQVNTSKEVAMSDASGKASGAGGSSRFSRFGFGAQIFHKTVGLVLKSRPDRQAKLGESNKFYYDEKLKRWVEEGAEVPADEPAFAPPPTTAAFQNGMPDYNLKNALKSEEPPANGGPEFKSPTREHSSGIPPIPPSTNQFSARGRMGIRSRYVDTFNRGGGSPANLFQSPSVPSVKPAAAANAKFFVPTPVAGNESTIDTIPENAEAIIKGDESPSASSMSNSFQPPKTSSSMPMQRFPSMDHITSKGSIAENGSFQSRSRRAASWSGSFGDATSPKTSDLKPLGEQLGMMPPSAFMPTDPSLTRLSTNGSFGDDLQEVEL
ncbi:Ancestral coatomer element 1, Sec16/Sec31 [Dillenia turbinata]|uniref:Protein transport protein sec16 n=1 Tax=Dillenia turbinata TaxID=194707 RepID=A0AAN8W7H7_9MAGN